MKLTFETHAPKALFLDPDILANAPVDMIAAGVGDLLGKISRLTPDFVALKESARKPFAQWEQEIQEAFLDAAPEIVALEKTAGKNSPQNLLVRLTSLETCWDQVKALAENTVKPQLVQNALTMLNAPTMPHQIGVPRQMAKQAILYAKEIRDRYTVLQLLWDLNELENFADTVINEYYAQKG